MGCLGAEAHCVQQRTGFIIERDVRTVWIAAVGVVFVIRTKASGFAVRTQMSRNYRNGIAVDGSIALGAM